MSLIRVRELSGVRAATTEASAEDLALISGPEFAGQNVTAADVHVRQMLLAHNQHDRTGERFPKAYLERFAETAPGKSALSGHDSGSLPLGRFFRADLQTRVEADFPVLVRQAAEGRDRWRQFEFTPERVRVTWLKAGFYFPADAEGEALRGRIDLGVYRDVSIGFRYDDLICDVCSKSYFGGDCPHVIGWRAEDNTTLVTGTYGGDPNKAEMLEGSVVWLGAQQQARLVKAIQGGSVDPKALAATPFGEDLVTLKQDEALDRHFGHAQKLWAVPALEPVASPTGEAQNPPVGG